MQLVVTVLSGTALFALVAVAISLVYRTTNLLNFGAGFIVVFCGIADAEWFGSPLASVVLTPLLGMFISLVMYYVAVRPAQLLGAPHAALTMSTLGFGMILTWVSGRLFGHTAFSGSPWVSGGFQVGGTFVAYQRVLMVAASAALIAALVVTVQRTVVGHGMQASAFDRDLAAVYGVRTTRSDLLSWLLAGACLGLAGSMQVAIAAMTENLGLQVVIFGLVAAVVGGLGGLLGAAVGAFVVSAVQGLLVEYVTSQYQVTAVFVLLFVMLALRPQGLLPSRGLGQRV